MRGSLSFLTLCAGCFCRSRSLDDASEPGLLLAPRSRTYCSKLLARAIMMGVQRRSTIIGCRIPAINRNPAHSPISSSSFHFFEPIGRCHLTDRSRCLYRLHHKPQSQSPGAHVLTRLWTCGGSRLSPKPSQRPCAQSQKKCSFYQELSISTKPYYM